jgi:site-specific DNA recombinase
VKVAAIYRVSTGKQVKRDGEETIPVQREAARVFIAAQPGWSLVKEYAEEGISGFKVSADDRDVLQQAFKDARAGLWQVLVIFKADRLSRNALEYPLVLDRFHRLGCEVWSVADAPGGRLLALDTQMDKFVRFLEGWQAETESKNTSIRVSEAMQQLARQGKWSGGPPPYGFRLNEARRPKSEAPALLIDPEQAPVVELMVRLYLEERMGCLLIARELNRLAIPNPAGKPWDDQKVRRILQNPIIAGLPAYGRNRQVGKHFTKKNPYSLDHFILPRDAAGNLRPDPAYQIIPLERWLKLLSAMQTARTPARAASVQAPHTVTARLRTSEALLTGLVFCGHCGARLSANSSGARVYYICQTHLHRGRSCCDGQRTYGCKRLERVVSSQLESLLTMLDGQELAEMLLGGVDHSRLEALEQVRLTEAEIRKADRVLQGWLARMDAFLASPEESPYGEVVLAAKIREARERRDALAATRRQLLEDRRLPPPTAEQAAELAAVAPHWWACFRSAPNAEKKVMLRDVVERIQVRRDEVEIIFRVDLGSFLPKARQMAAGRPPTGTAPVGPARQTERPLYPAPSP